MENRDIVKVLSILTPSAEWSLIGDNYDDIQWLSESIAKPTKAKVVQKHEEIINNAEDDQRKLSEAKAALLAQLGITEEQAKLLLG